MSCMVRIFQTVLQPIKRNSCSDTETMVPPLTSEESHCVKGHATFRSMQHFYQALVFKMWPINASTPKTEDTVVILELYNFSCCWNNDEGETIEQGLVCQWQLSKRISFTSERLAFTSWYVYGTRENKCSLQTVNRQSVHRIWWLAIYQVLINTTIVAKVFGRLALYGNEL